MHVTKLLLCPARPARRRPAERARRPQRDLIWLTRAPNTGITKAGGWVTLAFAVLAWYHAAGDVIGYTFGRRVLPMGSLRR
jgi:hypothetical protein